MRGRGGLGGGVPEPVGRLHRPPGRYGRPRVGEMLLGAPEAEHGPGGPLGQRPGGGIRLAEHGVRQRQAREGQATRAGEAVGLGQARGLRVVAASGRHPALQGRHPGEVRGEEDLRDGHPVGGDDLGAGSG